MVGVMYFYVFFTHYYFIWVSGLSLFPVINKLERLRTRCGRNMPCSSELPIFFFFLKNIFFQDFFGNRVVKMLLLLQGRCYFYYRGLRFDPWSENWSPQATGRGQKQNHFFQRFKISEMYFVISAFICLSSVVHVKNRKLPSKS